MLATVQSLQDAVERLKRLGALFLTWTGKSERRSTQAIVETPHLAQEGQAVVALRPVRRPAALDCRPGDARLRAPGQVQPHDYLPDFVIRLASSPSAYLVLETKGFDELAEVKAAAAQRRVAAENADGQHGV